MVHQYIKRILTLGICVSAGIYCAPFLEIYICIPILLLIFSVIDFTITGKKPPHLFSFDNTNEYFNKGGLRDLLRLIVTLFGFLYDVLVWLVWGVYLIFDVIVDIFRLVKIIFFWIIYAVLWVLKLYLPAVVILFYSFIHYFIRWVWWLYEIAFKNVKSGWNKNYYLLAFRGTFLALLLLFLFYYMGIVFEIPYLFVIGTVLSLLPLTWAFGEISSVRGKNLEHESFSTVKANFRNGIESVRSLLFYITLFVILILLQAVFNLFGWFSNVGISLIGLSFTINSLISLVLIFLFLIIFLGGLIIPTYRLYIDFSETSLSDTIIFIKQIIGKGLQYVLVLLPSAIFSVIISIIPILILIVAFWFTMSVKDGILNIKIESHRRTQLSMETELDAYRIDKKIENLRFLKLFPVGISQEMLNRNTIDFEIKYIEDDLNFEKAELLKLEEENSNQLNEINSHLSQLENSINSGYNDEITVLKNSKLTLEKNFSKIKGDKELIIAKSELDINFLIAKKRQISLLFLFAGFWMVIFGSLALAIVVAYLGNVFCNLYLFKNDGTPAYFYTLAKQKNTKDNKQPLLGFTLLILTLIILVLILRFNKMGYSLKNFYDNISILLGK
ncbi:MAG: hypothetical protein JXJ22_08835 [Bacteroidales bacterium]|nr:hypothetical protein [Bacteroidales bacterium]